jgi:hypothetical protein
MPKAGFNTILEVDALLTSGKVVANEPEMSIIYKRISAGSMPPSDVKKRPGAADIAAIKEWISCGADDFNAPAGPALAFMSIDTRLRSVLDDLRSIWSPVDRGACAFDLSSLATPASPATSCRCIARRSRSDQQPVARPRSSHPGDRQGQVAVPHRSPRLPVGRQTWNQLEAIYPYSVI